MVSLPSASLCLYATLPSPFSASLFLPPGPLPPPPALSLLAPTPCSCQPPCLPCSETPSQPSPTLSRPLPCKIVLILINKNNQLLLLILVNNSLWLCQLMNLSKLSFWILLFLMLIFCLEIFVVRFGQFSTLILYNRSS